MAKYLSETFEDKPVCYQIKLKGIICEDWSGWFNGMKITTQKESEENQITTLRGVVFDQAALRGILCKIWDLNMTIISVSQIVMNKGK